MREEPGGVGRAGVRSAAFDGRRTATHDRTRNHAGGRHPLRGASREAPAVVGWPTWPRCGHSPPPPS